MTHEVTPRGAAPKFSVTWFENVTDAHGDPETLEWSEFASIFEHRREGEKDGCCVALARFKLEPDGKHARRLKANLLARTAIALDIEMNLKTGEIPPDPDAAVERIRRLGWAAVVATSHSHKPGNPRYRIIVPLTAEIAPELPVCELVAERLGLAGVLDLSKIGAASLFFLPSCPHGGQEWHQTVIIQGRAIDAERLTVAATAVLATRQADADAVAAAARAKAAANREAKIAAGFDVNDSLIEKLRSHFDLDDVLRSHGYAKQAGKYRHPASSSGGFGADIKVLGGIERIFSHNATDPLHASNLPAWCAGVSALDVFDVIAILDFNGNRNRAMRELAQRFGLTKAAEKKALACMLFHLIRQGAAQSEIESKALAEGHRLGLPRDEICRVAQWVASRPAAGREAA